MSMSSQRILTVSQLTGSIRGLLETHFPFVSVRGEISNLRRPYSGHIYFTLKDDRAQLRAVLFKMQQRYLEEEPRDGQQVICRGRLSVYEPRGEYQIIVDTLDFHGEGALQLAFERLKKKLAAEGLFAADRKRKPPPMPDHITLVTSPGGAAVHDFIRVARARLPGIRLAVYPVAVQGETAAAEMITALAEINRHLQTDVIVLCRGGGSLEDLYCFNDEDLARAIRASRIPVVSAVGHEVDVTIADLAADLRAPTPSAAAEILVPDGTALLEQVFRQRARLGHSIRTTLDRYRDRLRLLRHRLGTMPQPLDNLLLQLDQYALRLEHGIRELLAERKDSLQELAARLAETSPRTRLQLYGQQLDNLRSRLARASGLVVDRNRAALGRAAALLDAVSPLATLERGYAIVRKDSPRGKIIRSADQVQPGEDLRIILHRGQVRATVRETGN